MNRRAILRSRLFKLQGGLCCYCGRVMKLSKSAGPQQPNSATVEHLQTKKEGGTLRLDNIACACFECNSGRGDIDWLTYKSMKMGEI